MPGKKRIALPSAVAAETAQTGPEVTNEPGKVTGEPGWGYRCGQAGLGYGLERLLATLVPADWAHGDELAALFIEAADLDRPERYRAKWLTL